MKAGRPPSVDKVAARAAYKSARANGDKVTAAVAAACEAGGFKAESYVIEEARRVGPELETAPVGMSEA